MRNRFLTSIERIAERRLLIELGLPALTFRMLLPGLVWNLTDALDWSEALVGVITFLLFLTSFLALPLRRLPGGWFLIIAAGGLGLMRLLMQVFAGSPTTGLGLAMAGMVLFFMFTPAYFSSRGALAGHFAPALLLGLVLDTAIHGARRLQQL
jgi:hypothetical protein